MLKLHTPKARLITYMDDAHASDEYLYLDDEKEEVSDD
jgi:hypothetical protein